MILGGYSTRGNKSKINRINSFFRKILCSRETFFTLLYRQFLTKRRFKVYFLEDEASSDIFYYTHVYQSLVDYSYSVLDFLRKRSILRRTLALYPSIAIFSEPPLLADDASRETPCAKRAHNFSEVRARDDSNNGNGSHARPISC